MSGFEVDLSYLQETVTKLQGVAASMDPACTTSKYETYLTREAIGGETFLEAGALYNAHSTMKTELEQMITTLQQMIQEFKDKTGHVHDQYSSQENTTTDGFNRGMA